MSERLHAVVAHAHNVEEDRAHGDAHLEFKFSRAFRWLWLGNLNLALTMFSLKSYSLSDSVSSGNSFVPERDQFYRIQNRVTFGEEEVDRGGIQLHRERLEEGDVVPAGGDEQEARAVQSLC